MTRINIVSRRDTQPSPWNGYLICTAIEGIPFALGAVRLRAIKYWWTETSEANGRQLMNEIGANMLLGCGKEIVNAVDRVYRLIDSNANGTVYSATGEGTEVDPYVYTPEIPVVPLTDLYQLPGERALVEDLKDKLANIINGELSDLYTNPRGSNQVLEDILVALQSEDDAETLEVLQQILVALGGAL